MGEWMGFPTRIRASSAQLAFLAASCMICSLAELAIPRLVPFFRLGLSNIPLMLALEIGLDFPSYLALIGLKALSQAIVGGTLFSYVAVLSIVSALSSGLVMKAFHLLREHGAGLSFAGISMAGAMASSICQILAGVLLLGRQALFLFFPIAALGLASSVMIGLAANAICSETAFINLFRSSPPQTVSMSGAGMGSKEVKDAKDTKDGNGAEDGKDGNAVISVLFAAAFLCLFLFPGFWIPLGLLVCADIWRMTIRRRIHPVRTVLFIVSVTAISLLSPYGKVLFDIGRFAVTQGALENGLRRSFQLSASIALSDLILHFVRLERLGIVSSVLGYAGRLGQEFAKHRAEGKPLLASLEGALCDAYGNPKAVITCVSSSLSRTF